MLYISVNGFLKSRTWFVVLLSSVISYATYLLVLYETLGRLSYRVTDRIYAKQLLQRLKKVET